MPTCCSAISTPSGSWAGAASSIAARRSRRWRGLDPMECAAGIHQLANVAMAEGIRVATVRRGVDPRGFTLLAFGGAAGLHVASVAAELGIGRVVVPVAA